MAAKPKTKAKSTPDAAPAAGTTIANSSFIVEAPQPLTAEECGVLSALASAIEANARAIQAVAGHMRGVTNMNAPMINVDGVS